MIQGIHAVTACPLLQGDTPAAIDGPFLLEGALLLDGTHTTTEGLLLPGDLALRVLLGNSNQPIVPPTNVHIGLAAKSHRAA